MSSSSSGRRTLVPGQRDVFTALAAPLSAATAPKGAWIWTNQDSPLLLRFAIAALVILLAGCSSGQSDTEGTAAPFSLRITNIDGPTVDVEVNGRIVAVSVCQAGQAEGAAPRLTPGGDLPPLPWTVRLLRKDDGSPLGTWTYAGDTGPRRLLIRGGEAGDVPVGVSAGPAPGTACAASLGLSSTR